MRKISFLIIMFAVLCCSCARKDSINDEMSVTEPTTTVGGYDNAIIDANSEITVSGTPYTDEEIMAALENDMEFLQGLFEPGSYLSRNGYYHVALYDGEINYGFYDLPVVKGHQIIGIITIARVSDTLTYGVKDYKEGHVLGELIDEQKELAMLYSNFSEYAVSGDNEVFTIYGNDNPEILNAEKLYSTFNLGDNLATEKIFDDSEYYYQWK